MSERFCSECGYPNPRQARFCISCGRRLRPLAAAGAIAASLPAALAHNGRPDWSGAATAVLVSLGLWHLSRKARQTAVVMLFLFLFFGLPMVCGFAAFVLEWLGRLTQWDSCLAKAGGMAPAHGRGSLVSGTSRREENRNE